MKKLAVLGGDRRQVVMARMLSDYGYTVKVWGLGKCEPDIGDAEICAGWESAVSDCDAVILPLPASADGVRVHCPLHDRDVLLRMTTLLDGIGGKRLYGGRLSEPIRNIAEQKGVLWVDYYDSEILQLKNALPTAEAAISIAMQELPVTLSSTSVAVFGYGRIGSLLAEKLQALGADVTVYARRAEQLEQAALRRHRIGRLRCYDGGTRPDTLPNGCRLILNTVPHRILERDELEKIPQNCVLIDLASAPGGFDHGAAQSLGLRCLWATALPGKCLPESAGIILAETLRDLIENETP